jgi:hypothetical protein
MLSKNLRKLFLTLHVCASVGWIGAVAAFLILSIAGIQSTVDLVVRSSFISMDLVARFLIVPLSFASLVTGLIVSIGTQWGLIKHYWIIFKFIITVLCVAILQLHMGPIKTLAQHATTGTIHMDSLEQMKIELLVKTAAAILALLITLILSVYKPKGITRFALKPSTYE